MRRVRERWFTGAVVLGTLGVATALSAGPAGAAGAATAPGAPRVLAAATRGAADSSPSGDSRSQALKAARSAQLRSHRLAEPVPTPDGARLTVPRPRAKVSDPVSGLGSGLGSVQSARPLGEPAQYRYAISVVTIPVRGRSLGVTRARMTETINRVGARMKQQTAGLVSYRARGWTVAPRTGNSALACDVDAIRDEYASYAKGLRRTPPGFTDTIAVYITGQRDKCGFSGMAMLGGDALYLNGPFLQDPQHLEDWIVAHELGHNLTLVHAGAFTADGSDWSVADSVVPQNASRQKVYEYGDYLDVMGAPPTPSQPLKGADCAKWTLDSVSQLNLGAMDSTDVVVARRSRSITIAAVRPGGSPTQPSAIAIPLVADGVETFWVLEYRPASQNPGTMNYPPPWDTNAYGVRLIEFEHVSASSYHINKVLRLSRSGSAASALPVATTVRLGGGAEVTVTAMAPASATVSVELPASSAAGNNWPLRRAG